MFDEALRLNAKDNTASVMLHPAPLERDEFVVYHQPVNTQRPVRRRAQRPWSDGDIPSTAWSRRTNSSPLPAGETGRPIVPIGARVPQ